MVESFYNSQFFLAKHRGLHTTTAIIKHRGDKKKTDDLGYRGILGALTQLQGFGTGNKHN